MATIKVLDTELELDLLDADELEKVDAALQAVEGDAQQDPALSQADNMRKQVGAVRKAFDTIFGEGTGPARDGRKKPSRCRPDGIRSAHGCGADAACRV